MIKGIDPNITEGTKVVCKHDLNKDGKKFNHVTIGEIYTTIGRTFSFLGSYYLTIINDRGDKLDYRCEDFDTLESKFDGIKTQ
jgi:hypothetical protein